MARRGAGLSSLQRHLDSSNSYSTLSSTLSSQQAQSLSSQLSTFQSSLSQFSTQHRSRITSSPSLRSHFTQLCAELGVDPLGGGAKGLWDKLGVGDWYYALGVQIVDVCLEARERGGGLVALDEVISAVERLRHAGGRGAAGAKVPPGNEITAEDVRKAIEVLEPLGCGYTLIETGGGRKVVQCYPTGLDRDSLAVVEAASERGRGIVTSEIVWEFKRDEGWTRERATRAVEKALGEGVIWIDEQASGGRQYAVPSLYDFGS